jgi:hypothetical protein
MFGQDSKLPANLHPMIVESCLLWDSTDVYVGSSGKFAMERLLSPLSRFKIHSQDQTLFGSMYGSYCWGEPIHLRLKEKYAEALAWATPYLDESPESALVALVILESMAINFFKRDSNAYYRTMAAEYERQFPTVHAKALAKFQSTPVVKLVEFSGTDVESFYTSIPEDAAVIFAPVPNLRGFVHDKAKADELFDWQGPFGEPRKDVELRDLAMSIVATHRKWMLVGQEMPELQEHLTGFVKGSNMTAPSFIYSSSKTTRIVAPSQSIEPCKYPRLEETEELGTKLTIRRITSGEFHELRSLYIARTISPGQESRAFGVFVDEKLIGLFAFNDGGGSGHQTEGWIDGPQIYMLSDMPVAPVKYKNLAKLIVMAAVSKEAREIAETMMKRRCRSLITTAFTSREVSMKYRGVLDLLKKEEDSDYGVKPEAKKYKLEYGALIGVHSLDEQLVEWKKRFSQLRQVSENAETE